MTRSDFPNKPGEYNIDGVNIIILPDKIIIDTGARQTTTTVVSKKRNTSAQSSKKEPKKKEQSLFATIMENAADFALHGENIKR